uniref:Putative secreted peptide n=1 Tax=Anopheles braziliensis TaxID=58242 RepID=A0A2M3ZSM5_9DIPT
MKLPTRQHLLHGQCSLSFIFVLRFSCSARSLHIRFALSSKFIPSYNFPLNGRQVITTAAATAWSVESYY